MSDQLQELGDAAASLPQRPAFDANPFVAARQRAGWEKELAGHFEKSGATFQRAGSTPETITPTGAQPTGANEDDIALLESLRADLYAKHRDNPQARAVFDKAWMAAHKGEAIDRDVLADALDDAVATPQSRATATAIEEFSKLIDADGNVQAGQIPRALNPGQYVLPNNVLWQAERTVALLAKAHRMQLTQSQLDAYLAEDE